MSRAAEVAEHPALADRGTLEQARQALFERFAAARPSTQGAQRLLRAHTGLVDATLSALWRQAAMPAQAALVAVGGYGRGELYPYSDVDVLVLLPDARSSPSNTLPGVTGADDVRDERITAFVASCWDAGLAIGSSVRTLAQCLAESAADITVQTALLECRLVCGSRQLYQAMRRAQGEAIAAKPYFRGKVQEMHQRHHKFGDTPYALEPNCKESPGGLRDLHMLIWLARAAKLGRSWSDLATRGLITPYESAQLQQHESTLRVIRTWLHLLARRREDRLLFDLQSALAAAFGYENSRHERASEVLMHRYYWAAKAVTQLNQIVLLNLQQQVWGQASGVAEVLCPRFQRQGNLLDITADDLYERDPHAILQTFVTLQATPGLTGLSARTLRALYNARHVMDGRFRKDPANRAAFMQMLKASEGQTRVLRLMNHTSVLGRYLWVFRRIVGRMQHDLFHVYTVDQHILMVLRNVRRFFIAEHVHEYPLCSQLASEFDKPWLLYIAALFHDIAKGRGGDHSELGAVAVKRFAADHGLAATETEMVVFLVREHLTMSQVAQKRDLSDPEVIAGFAQRVGDTRHLIALYLLTVADIRGTSPKVWNAWKAKLLEDLYHLTARALGGYAPNPHTERADKQTRALELLVQQAPQGASPEALWATLALSYFARHDAAEIAWHALALQGQVDAAQPVVRARLSPVGEGLQVMIYAPDAPDLFARICGFFDRGGFSIQDAKVHTTEHHFALDTFELLHPGAEAAPAQRYAEFARVIEAQAPGALLSTRALPPLRQARRSRRAQSFPVQPSVSLRPDEAGRNWLLTVHSQDRPGLLYAISRALADRHIGIHLAKIQTLGERVEDTFLISGEALAIEALRASLEVDLLQVLELV